MATFTATRGAANFPVAKGVSAGELQVAYGTISITANPVAADIYKMCTLPAGAVIVGGYLYSSDLDTGTGTLDMDIGWAGNGGSGTYDAADPDGLGNLGALTGAAFAAGNVSPVVGLIYPFSGLFATGVLPTFTRKTTIQLVANVTANAFTAGSLSIVVFYTNP